MSRVAKEPIPIPSGVKVDISGGSIAVSGPQGNLDMKLNTLVKVTEQDGIISVEARNSSIKSRAMSGTMRSLINNMIVGVNTGYQVESCTGGNGLPGKSGRV